MTLCIILFCFPVISLSAGDGNLALIGLLSQISPWAAVWAPGLREDGTFCCVWGQTVQSLAESLPQDRSWPAGTCFQLTGWFPLTLPLTPAFSWFMSEWMDENYLREISRLGETTEKKASIRFWSFCVLLVVFLTPWDNYSLPFLGTGDMGSWQCFWNGAAKESVLNR